MPQPLPPINYLTADDVHAMNAEILRQEGDQSLLRDSGALESAIMRPQMAAYYEQADLIAQASLLIAGLAMAHPFLDGNKRTAAIAGDAFLLLNGYEIVEMSDAYGRQLEALVTYQDKLSSATERFTAWLQQHVAPVEPHI
ncbi:MAG TPA: type II toxin-antitoxin system death-on-curing family toxin [Ktedonobacterales bacterium]|nr:type II toxin-antitoxin system death-on-curing family toxin [Ktedonobacterales bacterium]